MNSKKIVVIVLFLITVLIGALTIYLAVTLTKKNDKVTPTPTPYINYTPVPKKTATPTPSAAPELSVTPTEVTSTIIPTTDANIVCGGDCTSTSCEGGNTCLLVNGNKKCVADICLNKAINPPVVNDQCNGDLCTSKYSITLSKTAKVSCVTGQNQRVISFTLKIINPAGNDNPRTNITVKDDLTDALDMQYLRAGSISSGGVVTDKTITWSNLTLTPSGGFLELKYDMQVPPAEYGKKYTNSLSVIEGDQIRGNMTYNLDIAVLPCTALSKDDFQIITIGLLLVTFGMLFFRFNWHTEIGKIFWINGGFIFNNRIKKIAKLLKSKLKVYRLDLIQDKKTTFERKVSNKSVDEN